MNKIQVAQHRHNVSFVTLTRLARCMGCKGTGDKGQHTTSPNILSLCRLSQALRWCDGVGRGGGQGAGGQVLALPPPSVRR
jgi:hypothetical protein